MPKTILAIDDETDFLEEIREWLEEYGYKVLTAISGWDGFKKIQEALPSLILLDISMPDFDGFQILDQLKRDPATEAIPVIMLSARSQTSYIFEAQKMHAQDYVVKPFNQDELLAVIRRYER